MSKQNELQANSHNECLEVSLEQGKLNEEMQTVRVNVKAAFLSFAQAGKALQDAIALKQQAVKKLKEVEGRAMLVSKHKAQQGQLLNEALELEARVKGAVSSQEEVVNNAAKMAAAKGEQNA